MLLHLNPDIHVDQGLIRILQKDGFVEVERSLIARVKIITPGDVQIRLSDGRKVQLQIAHLSVSNWKLLTEALRESRRANRKTETSILKRGKSSEFISKNRPNKS